MLHRLVVSACLVVLSAYSAMPAFAQTTSTDTYSGADKVRKLLALAQGAGKNPTQLYARPTGATTVGHDFEVPALGARATATTLYTRPGGSTGPEIWHVALTFSPGQLGTLRPLRDAFPALANLMGETPLQQLVLIVSEADGEFKYADLDGRSVLVKNNGPLAVGQWLRGSTPTFKLKKGVNVFALFNRQNKPVLNALERIALSGGEPTGQNVVLRGTLGFDVISKLMGTADVDQTEEDKILAAERGQLDPATRQPLPFSVGFTYPRVVPAPFSLIANKADAKKLLYTELKSTKLDIAIDQVAKTGSISAAQSTDAWLLNNAFSYTVKLGLEETVSGAVKTFKVTGSGGLDLTARPVDLGLPDFKLLGIGPAITATYQVPANGQGDVIKTAEEGKAVDTTNSVGFALGATLQYGASRTQTTGLISIGLNNDGGAPRLSEFGIGLSNGIDLRQLRGLNEIEALARVNIEKMHFAVSLPQAGGQPNFALAGDIKIAKTPGAQGIGGSLGLMTKGNNFFVILRTDQTSIYAIADTFAQAGRDLLPSTSNERKVLASMVLPEVVLALGAGPSGMALTNDDLPKPILNMIGDMVGGSTRIPISTRGVTAIGKIDFDQLDQSVKDAMGSLGVTLKDDFLVAMTAEGFTPGQLQLGVNFQLPTVDVQSAVNQSAGEKTEGMLSPSSSSGTGSLFLRVNVPAGSFQVGASANMNLMLAGQTNPILVVGDLYVNVQATGAGVFFAGYTQGDWVAPLGIQGLTFRNGAILVGAGASADIDFGAGVKVAFDNVDQRQTTLGGTADIQFRESELDRLAGDPSGGSSNELSTGLYLALQSTPAFGIPVPKKLGFVFESSRMGFIEALRISDTLVSGLMTGPMATDLVNAINIPEIKQAMQAGNSVTDEILNAVETLPIPLTDLELRNTKLFFATPGAQLPGFDGLEGEMGVSIETDVYIRDKNKNWNKLQVTGTTQKAIIKVTSSGVDFGGLSEVIENTYLQVASVTIEALTAELKCPTGSTYNTLDGACLACPSGYALTGLPADDPGACLKIQPEYRGARFLRAANTPFNCPAGSTFDPRNEGECWKCPAGYIRNLKPVNDNNACTEIPSASTTGANKHKKATGWFGTDCPKGQFWHISTGYCYTCPSGYISDPFANPDSTKACSKIDLGLDTTDADRVKAGKPSDRGTFLDIGRAEFWTCQTSSDSRTWKRTLQPVNAPSNACKYTTTDSRPATTVPRGQIKTTAGLCLSVKGGNNAIRDNEPVVTKTCSTTDARSQSWFTDSLDRIRPLQQLSFEPGKDGALCLEPVKVSDKIEMQLQFCNLNATQKWIPDGQDRLVNNNKKQCMLRTGASGARVTLTECSDDAAAQKWAYDTAPLVDSDPITEPAEYAGQLIAASGQCLEAGTGSYSQNSYLKSCSATPMQNWQLGLDGNLRNVGNGLCAEAVAGSGTAVGLYDVKFRDCAAAAKQQWLVDANLRLVNADNDDCLQVFGTARAFTGDCRTVDEQRWRFDASLKLETVSAPAGYTYSSPTPSGPPKLQSALTLSNGATYLFYSNNKYSRASKGATRIDNGYPQAMLGGWKLNNSYKTSGPTAAHAYPRSGNKYYIYRDTDYARLSGVAMDTGYPKTMPGGWRALPTSFKTGLDAAYHDSESDRLYMVNGDKILQMNGAGTAVAGGYPKAISSHYIGLPSGFASNLDAATFRDGFTYLFKNEQYVKIKGRYVVSGPKAMSNFPEAPEPQVTSALTLANGITYTFYDNNTYGRYANGTTQQTRGYPIAMNGGWRIPGSYATNGPTAALPYSWNSDKNYLFRDNDYSRLTGVTVDSGYPVPMPGGWRNLPSSFGNKVDAAMHDRSYALNTFFRGDQVARMQGTKLYQGFPKLISAVYGNVPSKFHSNLGGATFRDGHVYLIKDGEYVKIRGTNMLSGYPKPMSQFPQ